MWSRGVLRTLCSALASLLEAPEAGCLGPVLRSLFCLGQLTPCSGQQAVMVHHVMCAPAASTCHACAACLPWTCLPCSTLSAANAGRSG
jgi:hypothetical protein